MAGEGRVTIPIMSIDPSLRYTGIALGHYGLADTAITVTELRLVETEKTIHKQTRKNSDDLRCARLILDALEQARADHKPIITLVEVPSGTQSARASWALGIMLGLIAALPHPVVELTAAEVKKGFVGDKAASKERMIERAVSEWPNLGWLTRGASGTLLAKNEHLADAVAVMSVGVRSTPFRELVRMAQAVAA